MLSLMDLLCDWIGHLPFECLQLRFMQEAFLGILLCAPLAAAAGVQVVNFRMSFFSDAIGHSAFAGVALGLLCSLGPGIMMPLLALAIGLGIMFLKRRSTLSSDTVIGVLFSAVVALGLALASRNPEMAKDMQMFLYGDILTIRASEILTLFILSVIFYGFQIAAFNRMIAIGISAPLARTHRIRVAVYEYVHVGLLALVVIFCVKAVGVGSADRSCGDCAESVGQFGQDVLDLDRCRAVFGRDGPAAFGAGVGEHGGGRDDRAVCLRPVHVELGGGVFPARQAGMK